MEDRIDNSDEIARLRRISESQEAALMHWRREADKGAGRIQNMHRALFQIAHGHDDLDAVRAIAREALA